MKGKIQAFGEAMEHAEYTPLLPKPQCEPQPEASHTQHSVFNDGPRLKQDRKWQWAFISTLCLLALGAVVLFFTSDHSSYLRDGSLPSTCPVGPGMSRGLLADNPDDELVHDPSAHPVWLVLATFACALGTGWLLVLGFKHRADIMVQVAVVVQIGLFATFGAAMLFASIVAGIIALCFAAGWAYLLLVVWKPQVQLVTRLLSLAGRAISETPTLIPMALGLKVFWGVVAVPFYVVAIVLAVQNGQWSQNPAALSTVPRMVNAAQPGCVDTAGQKVDCCTWTVHPGAIVYIVLLSLGTLWTAMVLDQVKQFTVAGAVAQWYFMPMLPSNLCGAAPARNRVMTSLRHALGPSFGSLCAAGLVMGIVNFLKQWLAACERRSHRSIAAVFFIIIAVILRVILSVVEFMTKFTTVRMAITGEAFIDAAKNTYDMLKRNAMDALGMWWLPNLILGNCALVIAGAYGLLVAVIAKAVWGAKTDAEHWWSLSVVVSLLAMLFFLRLLLIAVDTMFLAAAMDHDAARVTRQEVHDILKDMPGMAGMVVEQPDGNLAYGAATETNSTHAATPAPTV